MYNAAVHTLVPARLPFRVPASSPAAVNDKFHNQLIQDLRRSGFYSEMEAIRACTSAKWECRGSFTYFDKDERATRECDFEAVSARWSPRVVDGMMIRIIGRLLGQVKKSQNPWIAFIDRHVNGERFNKISEITTQGADVPPRNVADALQKHSLIAQKGWIASGIHEAFKKPSDHSKWYPAFVSACKATESALDAAVAHLDGMQLQLIKPVVILDGILVAAELSTEGELVLTETDSAPFAFEYRSDAYERPGYYLDVVTLEAFPRYLEWTEARLASVAEAVVGNKT
jgi:hypothetical protein